VFIKAVDTRNIGRVRDHDALVGLLRVEHRSHFGCNFSVQATLSQVQLVMEFREETKHENVVAANQKPC
jgi:hypothetical protein